MKLTIVSVSLNGFHVDQLREEAKKKNIEFNVLNFSSITDLENRIDEVGNVVLWRNSDLDVGNSRPIAMQIISKKAYLISIGVGKYPFVTNKFFQQKTVEQSIRYASIPTFLFLEKEALLNSIQNGDLKYPFIQKPNLGKRGIDVRLIRSEKDLDENVRPIKHYVYQNFIKNNGDYRAFVLGGKILGVMKRVAKEGSILNNVSRGASAYVETDTKVIKQVRDIALKVSSLFELQMCGVDVIFDIEQNKYCFLEVNTVPQWKGFYGSTGINVAEEIVDYCIAMSDNTSSTFEKVKNFFDANYKYLGAQKFHYASRLFLWTKEDQYREKLDQLKNDLYSLENDVIENRIKRSIFEEPVYKTLKVSQKRKARREIKEKYPMMKKYSEVLVIWFFAKNLYNLDITSLVEKYIPTTELVDLSNTIINDRETIANGSTTCVNLLYFAREYLSSKNTELKFSSDLFLNIASELLNEDESKLDQKIYLLTHTIIGESKMYTQKAELNETNKNILKTLEKDISKNYGILRLDHKLEFLVCAKLCGYETYLHDVILSDAENSLSKIGNFIVDTGIRASQMSSNLNAAEHRNVLYLMCKNPR